MVHFNEVSNEVVRTKFLMVLKLFFLFLITPNGEKPYMLKVGLMCYDKVKKWLRIVMVSMNTFFTDFI